MRSRSAGLGRLVRYVLAGATSSGLYAFLTLALDAAGLPIQVAIAVAYALAVVVNFALQRNFVFTPGAGSGYRMSTRHQALSYVVVGVVVVGGAAAATTWLPALLGVSEEVVYLGTVVITPLFTFTALRSFVFRPHASSP